MSGRQFRFKKFSVGHSRSAMKVGTDGVLLGSWFDAGHACCNILDIGTGTGLIALMAAQRNPSAKVDAVENDANACLDATENFFSSPWSERLILHQTAIQDYATACDMKYDRIVSNPPYFINSLKNPDDGRRAARHNENLSFGELLDAVRKLLLGEGIFSVILPAAETEIFTVLAEKEGLFPIRVLSIHPTTTRGVKRIVTEFSYTRMPIVTEKLVIEEGGRHRYSENYRKLTRDFYLDF